MYISKKQEKQYFIQIVYKILRYYILKGDYVFLKTRAYKMAQIFIIGLFRFRFTPLQHIVDI